MKDPMNDTVIDWKLGEAFPIPDVIKTHKKQSWHLQMLCLSTSMEMDQFNNSPPPPIYPHPWFLLLKSTMLHFLSILTNIIPKGAKGESLNLKKQNKKPGIKMNSQNSFDCQLSAVIPWALTGKHIAWTQWAPLQGGWEPACCPR